MIVLPVLASSPGLFFAVVFPEEECQGQKVIN